MVEFFTQNNARIIHRLWVPGRREVGNGIVEEGLLFSGRLSLPTDQPTDPLFQTYCRIGGSVRKICTARCFDVGLARQSKCGDGMMEEEVNRDKVSAQLTCFGATATVAQ